MNKKGVSTKREKKERKKRKSDHLGSQQTEQKGLQERKKMRLGYPFFLQNKELKKKK